MTVNAFTYPRLTQPSGAYSHAAFAGDLVFTAGVGPTDVDGVMPEGIGPQTKVALANLEAVLASSGSSLGDVVKVTVHLSDLDRDFDEFDSTYRAILPSPYPVRTTVGSQLGGILIEIDAVAVVHG